MQILIQTDEGELLWRMREVEQFNLSRPMAVEVLQCELIEALERIKNNPDYQWVE